MITGKLVGILRQSELILPTLSTEWDGPEDMLGIIRAGNSILDKLSSVADTAQMVPLDEVKIAGTNTTTAHAT